MLCSSAVHWPLVSYTFYIFFFFLTCPFQQCDIEQRDSNVLFCQADLLSQGVSISGVSNLSHILGSGGRSDPNINNTNTNVGFDIGRYQCNKSDTLVCFSPLPSVALVPSKSRVTVQIRSSDVQTHFAPPHFPVLLCIVT